MKDPVLYKSEVIHEIRGLLRADGYVELSTPIIRNHGDNWTPRRPLGDGRYLRDSPALALRRNLYRADRIFEIGPCFRLDERDKTHLPEFTMLDLYTANETIDDVLSLATKLIQRFYSGPLQHLSFLELARDQFGVDLDLDPQAETALSDALAPKYGTDGAGLWFCLDRFIKAEIEPLSKDCCLVLVDSPVLLEARARRRPGSIGVAERFEFLIGGVEVVHGYSDETNLDDLVRRATQQDHFSPEDELICTLVREGKIPLASAGFGVGLERLCQACFGVAELSEFMPSLDFTL